MVLPAVLILLAGVTRGLVGAGEDLAVGLLGGFALGTLVPLLALIAGTGALGPEIDDGSIVYLLSKPLSRFTIATTKLAIAVAVVTVMATIPTFVAGLVLTGTSSRLALGYAVGAGVAGISYCALFLLLSVLTRHAVIVGLVYAVVWESLVGSFVPGAQALSILQWSLAVTERVVGAPAATLGVSSAVSLGAAVPLLLVVSVGCTVYAGWRLRTLRLIGDE